MGEFRCEACDDNHERQSHVSGRAPVTDEELEQWAKTRADDAGHLARELVAYRRTAPPPQTHMTASDGWQVITKFFRYPFTVEMISGRWHLRKALGNGASYTISDHDNYLDAITAMPTARATTEGSAE